METLNETFRMVNYQSTTYADTTSQSSAFQSFSRDVTTKEVSRESIRTKETELTANFMIIFSRFYDRSRDKQSKSGIIFPYCTVFFFLIRPKYLLSFSKKKL